MLKKLKLKFVVYSMSIVAVMLGLIFGTQYHFTAQSMEMESRQFLQTLMMAPMQPSPRDQQANLPYFILELGPRGNILSAYGTHPELENSEFVLQAHSLVLKSGQSEGQLSELELRFARSASPAGGRLVFVDSSIEASALKKMAVVSILVGFAGLLAFFGLSLLLANFAVKPVEKAWEQQRLFVADASHELKTPLTVIMTSAELMQGDNCAEAERLRFAQSILSMSHQMRGLVEGLLELARVDSGSAAIDFEELSFSRLACEAILPFEPLYFENSLTLDSCIEPELRIRGSRRQLYQVLDILLDNALKYSAPNSSVELKLQRQGCHCLLSLKSPGQPLEREELKNIFKRFYRSDRARSLNGSYGLGLAIAKAIVTGHKGRIWAEAVGDGNIFYVALPMI